MINLDQRLVFFVGTVAELIKVMPVIRACVKRQLPVTLIASGQNALNEATLLELSGKPTPDITLSNEGITQTPAGLLWWFTKTLLRAPGKLRREFPGPYGRTTFVVHGDTVSTVMGALLGRYLGAKVAHLEAGLRSYNWLHPFPEEIDRVITSRLARLHLCPNGWAAGNLKHVKGEVVDTGYNTLVDSLRLVTESAPRAPILDTMGTAPFFVFVIHRQENIYNAARFNSFLYRVLKVAETMCCLFILHRPTAEVLERHPRFAEIKKNPNVVLSPRLPYAEFMQVLRAATFIVTDGGSNQEECSYIGLPCLILRERSERIEGLGENVRLWEGNDAVLGDFLRDPERYRRAPLTPEFSPSELIADVLQEGSTIDTGAERRRLASASSAPEESLA